MGCCRAVEEGQEQWDIYRKDPKEDAGAQHAAELCSAPGTHICSNHMLSVGCAALIYTPQ